MDAAQSYAGGVILALDTAKSTGVCEGAPGDMPRLETVNFAKGGGDEFAIWARAGLWMQTRLCQAISDGRPVTLVVLEGMVPQYDKTLQCGIYAVIGATARNDRIPIITAMPKTWRASVLGDGNLNRAKAKARALWVTSQLGWHPDTDDAAEAGCLWLWATMQLAPRRLPRLPLFMRDNMGLPGPSGKKREMRGAA